MTGPGQPGSQTGPGSNWMTVELRKLRQQIEQLRGQLSRARADANSAVANVSVSGSVLTVTFGDGTTRTYQLP